MFSVRFVRAEKIATLRAQLHDTFPDAVVRGAAGRRDAVLPTGIEGFDRVLGGGLAIGEVTAWLGASYEVKSFRRVEQSGSVAAPPRRGLGLWYT